MKKILFLAISLACCFVAAAQTDIRTLSEKDSQALIKQFGTPVLVDHGEYYMCADYLKYDHFEIALERVVRNGKEGRSVGAFQTDSNQFCFLSDIYPGGIKVGTKLSDLQRFDFVNCKYGGGNSANGLRKISTNEGGYLGMKKRANYIIFEKAFRFYYFTVENGQIVEWTMSTRADATPDPNVSTNATAH